MEFKHFSHNHGLIVHQVIQGTEVNCSGCSSSATGTIYVCWPCNFFLHEFCFNASRSMNHPSHPPHPLTLVPYPTYPSNSFYCNSCNLVGNGLSYSCSNCDFDLHVHCAYMPTSVIQTPQTYNVVPSNSLPDQTSSIYHPQQANLPPINVQTPQTFDVVPNNSLPDQTSSIYHPQQANLPPVNVQTPQTYDVVSSNSLPDQTSSAYHPQQANLPPVNAHDDPTLSYNTKNEATADFVSPLKSTNPSGEVPVQCDEPVPAENTGGNRVIKPRGLKHFSHSHPMYPSEVEDGDPLVCSGCEEEIIGTQYGCSKSKCDYHLHKKCFELPREIRHKSHTEHPLTLLASPSNKETGKFTCNACFGVGSGFTYNCSTCDYDLHVSCSVLPETVKSDHHDHELSLIYSSPISENEKEEQPEITFSCSVCENVVPESYWLYYCADCKYGTHLSCVHEKDKYEGKSLEEVVIDHQAQMQRLQIQMDMARQNAQFLISMGQSLASL